LQPFSLTLKVSAHSFQNHSLEELKKPIIKKLVVIRKCLLRPSLRVLASLVNVPARIFMLQVGRFEV
jgi:hypothetical protein